MKKSIKLMFILLLILFIVACSKQPSASSSSRFVGGSDGLDISFIKDEPPDTVLDDNQDEFDIALSMENAGEEDINAGDVIVTLNGIEKDAFSLSSLSAKNEDFLAGKKKLTDRVIPGEQGEVLFTKLKYKDKLPADFDVEVRADVCYEYGTRSMADMCLKKEASKRRTNDQCEVSDDSVEVDNSGAPIKITNFAQRPKGSDKVQFTFDIEKTGSGDVFETGTFSDKCIMDNDRLNKVNVEVNFLRADAGISCTTLSGKNKGIVKLLSGKRTIRCDVSSSSLQDIAFKKPLLVKIDYEYKDSISKTFIVESTEF